LQVKVNDNIILVGTAHISKDSVKEVKTAIEKYKPDVVAVELCQRRYESLTEKDKWDNTPITSLLKSNKAYLVLAQTFLSSIQRRLGKEYGVEPGSEMVAALEEAKKHGLEVELVDRDIAVTLKRAWRKMGIREKIRLAWEFMKVLFGYEEEELDRIDLEELMKEDVISSLMKEFGEIAPSVSNVLITERDSYIAKKISDIGKDKRVIAVVGAGHVKGIENHLKKKKLKIDLKELEEVPKKRISIMKTVAYAIPVIVVVLIAYLFLTGGWELAADAIIAWILINGILSAVGALIARAHPYSILTAFVAAPITSLNPTLAAGWFAGIVEAKMRTPKVKDFQGLSKIESMKDFFGNRVIRLLMVVALANVGSMIGTFVALSYIIPKIF
jgi:pheromone shutdown-related protein TraB